MSAKTSGAETDIFHGPLLLMWISLNHRMDK